MQKYVVYTDPYYGVTRLDLYEFDGSPMNPMYIAYSPPLMLPTQTMNPTTTATGAAETTGASKRSVDAEELVLPLNKDATDRCYLDMVDRYRNDCLWRSCLFVIV